MTGNNDKHQGKNISEQDQGSDLFPMREISSPLPLITEPIANQLEELLQAMKEDPSIVEELYKVLNVIQKDKTDRIPYKRIRNFAWHKVPLGDITTDVKNFQNRRKPYSEHSAQGIVDAVKTGEFKWKMFTPALLWKNTEDILYVLAGHSRDEAFKRLSTTLKDDDAIKAYCEKHNSNFEDLPSLILNDIGFDEAKIIAGMSNALATAETDVERSDIYRQMRMMGRDKESIEAFGRKCEKSNRSRVRSFSYLAPNGMAMDMLYAFEIGEDNNYVVKRISYRIGELRRKNPEISDIHEGELFDRLLNKGVYGKNKNKGEINKMDIFIDIVEKHIQQLKIHNEFAPDQLLNITKIKNISYVMKYYYDTLNVYRAKKNVLMQEFNATRRKMSQLKANTDVSEEKRLLFQKLEEQFQISFKTINQFTDVGTATGMLFDTKEVYLNPDEEIARCEEIQVALMKEIQEIERKYYVHRWKKDNFQRACKTVVEIDFSCSKEEE